MRGNRAVVNPVVYELEEMLYRLHQTALKSCCACKAPYSI